MIPSIKKKKLLCEGMETKEEKENLQLIFLKRELENLTILSFTIYILSLCTVKNFRHSSKNKSQKF